MQRDLDTVESGEAEPAGSFGGNGSGWSTSTLLGNLCGRPGKIFGSNVEHVVAGFESSQSGELRARIDVGSGEVIVDVVDFEWRVMRRSGRIVGVLRRGMRNSATDQFQSRLNEQSSARRRRGGLSGFKLCQAKTRGMMLDPCEGRQGRDAHQVASFVKSVEGRVARCLRAAMLGRLVEVERAAEGGRASSSVIKAKCVELGSELRRLSREHDAAVQGLLRLATRSIAADGWREAASTISRRALSGAARGDEAYGEHLACQVAKVAEASTLEVARQHGSTMLNWSKVSLGASSRLEPPPEELRSCAYREIRRRLQQATLLRQRAEASWNSSLASNLQGRRRFSSLLNGLAKRLYRDVEAEVAALETQAAIFVSPWYDLLHVDECTAGDALGLEPSPRRLETELRAITARCESVERCPSQFEIQPPETTSNVGRRPRAVVVDASALQHRIACALEACSASLSRLGLKAAHEVASRLDGWLEQSLACVARRPQSVQDIAIAQRDFHAQFKMQVEERRRDADKLVAYADVLGGEAVILAESLGAKLEQLQERAEAFGEMLDSQKAHLQHSLEEVVLEEAQEISALATKWGALAPHSRMMLDPELEDHWTQAKLIDVLDDLDKWSHTVEEMRIRTHDTKTTMEAFCAQGETGSDLPARRDAEFKLDAIASEITDVTRDWRALASFRAELDMLKQCDWISFRANIFALVDLADKHAPNGTVAAATATAKESAVATTGGAARASQCALRLNVETERLRLASTTLKYCHGRDFKDDHWVSLLQTKLGLPREVRLDNLTLGHLLDRIHLHSDLLAFCKQLTDKAAGELLVRESLNEVAAYAMSAQLTLVRRTSTLSNDNAIATSGEVYIVSGWKETLAELGDKQSLLGSAKDSPFYASFEELGATYETKLNGLDLILRSFNKVQRKWLYLDPIFKRGGLPNERYRFEAVDTEILELLANIQSDPKLFNLARTSASSSRSEELQSRLVAMLDQLERCQKALTLFLEEKRNAFPRFYFVGDDDLLEILGHATSLKVVTSQLKNFFMGVAVLEPAMHGDLRAVCAIRSVAHERVALNRPVSLCDAVETWLLELGLEIRGVLAGSLKAYLENDAKLCFVDDDAVAPSQIVCLGEQIRFAENVEAVEALSDLAELRARLRDDLESLAMSQPSTPLAKLKLNALVLDLVHSIDVVDQLETCAFASTNDWVWTRQLRYAYYGDADSFSDTSERCSAESAFCAAGSSLQHSRPCTAYTNVVMVKIASAIFDYTFEYQGNVAKLVHTPLTDKCYLTLCQAMHMGFGGNPYGPAGTGKTESVKALGNALGRQVVVFNWCVIITETSIV